MASWTGKRSNVTYSKPAEPSFLKKFKERVGYKEDHGLSDKFQNMPKSTSEDLEDQQDELPQVVQLNPGDITQDEYKTILSEEKETTKIQEDNEDSLSSDGKIKFRKPTSTKRKIERNSSSKKTNNEIEAKKNKKSKKEEKSNKKLLSFDDDDEEDDI